MPALGERSGVPSGLRSRNKAKWAAIKKEAMGIRLDGRKK
jgi:hypothetical protein